LDEDLIWDGAGKPCVDTEWDEKVLESIKGLRQDTLPWPFTVCFGIFRAQLNRVIEEENCPLISYKA
jgi:hypothetical protein